MKESNPYLVRCHRIKLKKGEEIVVEAEEGCTLKIDSNAGYITGDTEIYIIC